MVSPDSRAHRARRQAETPLSALCSFPKPALTTRASEQAREERIKRACEKKFPKLEIWRHSHAARTVLVLEDNDMQLTNHMVVTDAFLKVAKARADGPDETYMVTTCAPVRWYGCPILIDGCSYFDLADASDKPIHFEIEPLTTSKAS